VVERERLSYPTVTVAALAAVADALGGHLDERGEDISQLGAEVPMAAGTGPVLLAHNNFRNVGVDLYPELAPAERADRITAQLAAHRRRGEHPAMRASVAAFAAVPAAVLLLVVAQEALEWGLRGDQEILVLQQRQVLKHPL
jgi:hypothetical protein